jgi:hypothetical protein
VTVLLQVEAFAHQPLQAGPVEDVVSKFLVRKHGEGRALGSGNQFGGFFHGEVRVLADDRHDHVDHYLEASDFLCLLQTLVRVRLVQGNLVPAAINSPLELDVRLSAGVAIIVDHRSAGDNKLTLYSFGDSYECRARTFCSA